MSGLLYAVQYLAETIRVVWQLTSVWSLLFLMQSIELPVVEFADASQGELATVNANKQLLVELWYVALVAATVTFSGSMHEMVVCGTDMTACVLFAGMITTALLYGQLAARTVLRALFASHAFHMEQASTAFDEWTVTSQLTAHTRT